METRGNDPKQTRYTTPSHLNDDLKVLAVDDVLEICAHFASERFGARLVTHDRERVDLCVGGEGEGEREGEKGMG